jgi:phosphatidylglycerophosphatase A
VNEASAPVSSSILQRNNRLAWAVATCGGLGHLRPGPGTWTSAAVLLAWWAGTRTLSPSGRLTIALVLFGLVVGIGIPAATSVARARAQPDPSIVVVDEVAGQLLALVAVPLQWKYLVVSFILFRGFDIFKPPPLRLLERFPGGWGIMLDDVGAGLYAFVVMQLLLYSGIFG